MSTLPESIQRELTELRSVVANAQVPQELALKMEREIVALERSATLGNYDEKFEKVSRYIEWIVKIPWAQQTPDQLDLEKTKAIFEEHHFGMQEVKDRFLEYVSVLKLRATQDPESQFKAPIMLLVGLVGTGKTTFAYSLSEALGRKLIRIPFGGMSSSIELRGETRFKLGAEPGKVIKGICAAGVRNPIFLLDEIDRSNEEANMDIMGVLVELLDPNQNTAYVDNYVDYPINLGQSIFIATANNTTKIATAVLDRMEKIAMPSYTDQEKIVIAHKYIMPELFKETGLRPDQFKIEDDVWPLMVRPLGFDAGIRTLQRTLQTAVRRAARIIVERGFSQVVVTRENAKIFLPGY